MRPEPVAADRLRPMAVDDRGAGPPVVLLHGQPGDHHDWDDVVAALGGGVRTLAPDRPGYGRTGGPAGGFAANADALVGLLDERGLPGATLVGHSWGGGVAIAAAVRHPARVSGLVLVSSVGGDRSGSTLDRVLGAPVVGPMLAFGGLAALRAARVRRLLAPVTAPGNPAAMESLPAGWLSSWRSFVAEERGMLRELPALAGGLAGVVAPAVVVIGGADRVVPPASQERLAASLPGAQAVRVPGCGHLLPREAPDAVAAAIVQVALGSGGMIGA